MQLYATQNLNMTESWKRVPFHLSTHTLLKGFNKSIKILFKVSICAFPQDLFRSIFHTSSLCFLSSHFILMSESTQPHLQVIPNCFKTYFSVLTKPLISPFHFCNMSSFSRIHPLIQVTDIRSCPLFNGGDSENTLTQMTCCQLAALTKDRALLLLSLSSHTQNN